VFFLQVTASLNNRPFFLFDMKLYYSIALWVITGLMFVYWMLLPEVEVKANEEVIEVKYATDRETHLYNKVEKTVDLPWFWDYQDLLASYAYNTCKKVEKEFKKWSYQYDCKTFILVLNSENGWRNHNAWNKNNNWTKDWGIGQLNSKYHWDFINSEHFKNPLSQIDYTLWVWKDASMKNKMPRYWYWPRHKRDKWIKFSDSWVQENKDKSYLYDEAIKAQKNADYWETTAKNKWLDCIQWWVCK